MMAGPPSKKRRTVIDSLDESPPLPEVTSNCRDVFVSSSKAQTSRALVTTRRPPGATSKSKTAKPKTTIVAPPKRQSPIKSKKLTGKYKSLHSFFGVPQGGPFPVPTTSKKFSPPPSQNEDVEDLIEDVSDDEEVVTTKKRTIKKDSSLQSHLVVSKPGVGNGFKGLLATKVPRSSQPGMISKVVKKLEGVTSAAASGVLLTILAETRTWPEKYAPRTVEDLALNKMKVKEVRTWLESVFGRSSRQRVLVLRGSAGTGKTATVNALAKEMGVEILEWRNPHSATDGDEYGTEGAFAAGLSGMFEEFVGRAGTFASLDLVSSNGKAPAAPSSQDSATNDEKKKLIVIEDFPNTLFTSSSAPLQSFRHTIKSFLALPTPPTGASPLPPLILIITETASISGPNSFTAHRLLSPEILHHPLVKEISFNKIAPTYMYKALSVIVVQESRESGRKFGPSKAVLDTLSTSGDIRSAIMGLEFLAKNGDLPGMGFSERIVTGRRRGKKPEDRALTAEERRMVEAVTQRESTYGIFHAVGKVLYNKRYGDDPEDEYCPPQPRPPLDTLPYHTRKVRMDLETLIDETGTDPQTFISGLHENYLGSCNPGGLPRLPTSDEDVLDTVNLCLDYFSDSDILALKGFGYNSPGSGDTAGIRADEISFQTAVRGIMMSLPSPVKRFLEPKGGGNKMFYPTLARLWKDRQEVSEVAEWFVEKQRETGPCKGGKAEALEERMPYLALVERRREWARRQQGVFARRRSEELDTQTKTALTKATVFKGVGRQSEDPADDVVEEVDAEQTRECRGRWKKKKSEEIGVGEAVEKLVLSDDDIEEF